MEWLPLELWRASSLAQETKTCEAAYERLSKSGANSSQLATLRRSIEHRIDELETFFIENLDDERAVLFEKQVRDHASAAAVVCTPAAVVCSTLLSRLGGRARDGGAGMALRQWFVSPHLTAGVRFCLPACTDLSRGMSSLSLLARAANRGTVSTPYFSLCDTVCCVPRERVVCVARAPRSICRPSNNSG